MISKIKIKNFKSIIELELNLESSKTILVGQNEAGKSSILEAIDAYQLGISDPDNVNYECENNDDFVQEISVEYTFTSKDQDFFHNDLIDDIGITYKNADAKSPLSKMIFFPEKFTKVQKFTLTRIFEFTNDEVDTYMQIDKATLGKIIKATESDFIETPDGNNAIDFDVEESLSHRDANNEIVKVFHAYCPEIIFFNDFSDILPDKIKVSEIYNESKAEGKKAVKNIGKILGCSFKDISKQNVRRKKTNTEKASKDVSVEFLSDWNQQIDNNNQLKIEFDIEKNSTGEDEVHFFIETKEGVKLEPRKRSQGLRWFLSLWLEIKAESKHDIPMVLLFDEPGAHLHINAMKDMMSLFDKLCDQRHQILYSTHLPSMIDLKKIESLKLVIHDKVKGTIVEKVTSNRFNTVNRRDALQPIAQAMGMQPLTEFSVLRQKNVIVEGLSDMLYFQAMKKILNKYDDYAIVPGIGVKNEKLNSLISFCIGYGLEWLVVLDNGYNPTEFVKQLKTCILDEELDDSNLSSIYITESKEIEDMFSFEDINQLGLKITNSPDQSVSKLIGTKRKILFAQQFHTLVNNGKIKKCNLNSKTIKEFEKVFDWIDSRFDFKK